MSMQADRVTRRRLSPERGEPTRMRADRQPARQRPLSRGAPHERDGSSLRLPLWPLGL